MEKSRPSRGCLLAHGQNVACRVVLTWLWEQYKKAFPTADVPYSFPLPCDEGEGAQPSSGVASSSGGVSAPAVAASASAGSAGGEPGSSSRRRTLRLGSGSGRGSGHADEPNEPKKRYRGTGRGG